jgi:transcriptional regulator with XRE-family HTH domain
MKTIGEKIKEQRESLGMTQRELAEKTELSTRTVNAYEAGSVAPRSLNIKRLCRELHISEAYLTNPEIEDPKYGLDEAPYVDAVRDRYGKTGAKDMEELMNENAAFLAIMAAYLATKEDASNRFNPHKNK